MASDTYVLKLSELHLDAEVEQLLRDSSQEDLLALYNSFELTDEGVSMGDNTTSRLSYAVKYALYLHTRDKSDLQRAIQIAEAVLRRLAEDEQEDLPGDFAALSSNLSYMLHAEYHSHGDHQSLERAFSFAESAMNTVSMEDKYYPYYKNHTEQLSAEKVSLERAFSFAESATNAASPEDEYYSYYKKDFEQLSSEKKFLIQHLIKHGAMLLKRCRELSGDRARAMEDALQAKECLQQAVGLSEGLSDEPICLNLLGAALNALSNLEPIQEKALDYVDSSISLARQAVLLEPKGYRDRARCFHTLTKSLTSRFELTASRTDLEDAVNNIKEAFLLCKPYGDDDALGYGAVYGYLCCVMFKFTFDVAQLNTGIEMCEDLLQESSGDAGECMLALSQLLCLRHSMTGSSSRADIDRAVEIARKSITEAKNHPGTHHRINPRRANLASILYERGPRLQQLKDAREAVEIASDVLNNSRPTDSHWTRMFHIVMDYPQAWTQSGQMAEYMVELATKSLDNLTTPGRNSFKYVYCLARALGQRAIITKNIEDISCAIDLVKTATVSTEEGHLHRGLNLDNLARLLEIKCELSTDNKDLDEAVEILVKSCNVETDVPISRINRAHRAAQLLLRKGDWAGASALLEEAVERLSLVNLRLSPKDDIGHNLSKFSGLVSLTASTALMAEQPPGKVLEIIEHGRGIILGGLFQTRSDLAKLRELKQPLAEKFERLRDALDAPGDDIGDASLHQATRNALEKEFNQVIEDIRALGVGLFPTERTREVELLEASRHGTIIVVIPGATHSDALVLKPDGSGVVPISLPDLKLAEIEERADALRDKITSRADMFNMLEWLWDSLVSPVLSTPDVLPQVSRPDGAKPRVWWIPVGRLCGLPIHAAGLYPDGRASPGQTSAHRVLSSYAPSIKSLLYSRNKLLHHKLELRATDVLLVSMEKTAQYQSLPNARKEVDGLAQMLHHSDLPSNEPVVLHSPPASDVRKALATSRVFHFAGHGSADLEPLRSALLLEDEPLTVEQLLDLKPRADQDPPFLAYLSACSTGTTKSANHVDETMHLMSAFQLVGFRHVIGSLWELWDEHCVTVAKRFYDGLVAARWTDESVCGSLHEAISELRSTTFEGGRREPADEPEEGEQSTWGNLAADDPRLWAAYIHMGP